MGSSCSSCSRTTGQGDELDVSDDTTLLREEEVMKMPVSAKASVYSKGEPKTKLACEPIPEEQNAKKVDYDLKGVQTILVEETIEKQANTVAKRSSERKGTGFVRRKEEAANAEDTDTEDRQPSVRGEKSTSFQPGTDFNDEMARLPSRTSMRKPTGAIPKEKLAQVLAEDLDRDDD